MTRAKTPARLAIISTVAALAAGVGVPLATSAGAATAAAKPKGPCGQSWTVYLPTTYALFPKGKTTTVYAKPVIKGLKKLATIKDPMPDGTRGVLMGLDATVTGKAGWLAVWYGKPNNKGHGWVKLDSVVGAKNKYSIQINRKAHKLAVVQGTKCFGVFPVAVGAPASPTPAGIFYVNDRIPAPNAAYGHHLLGTDAASPTYKKFDDLDAAIGIHGTNEPNLIGKSISHGCIRMLTKDSDKIFPRIQSGTPIVIT